MTKRKKPTKPPVSSTGWLRWVGIGALILSFVFYGSLLLLPFLSITGTMKAAAIPVLIVLAEIAFWIGGVILGREFVLRYRRYFDPRKWWRR
ncbi:MAG: transporter suffix domain-containing protein [Caldilineaceae bacterium]